MLDGDLYLWVKALHTISVIAWMAGLLYLPRLFIYHCEAEAGSQQSETFKVMERRLLKAIMNPAMIASLLFGILLVVHLGAELLSQGWFHVKVLCLVAMMAMHMKMGAWRRAFAEDRNPHTTKFYRWMNEVPTVLMIVIVIMVIVQPF